jgi:hypothetical protein
VYADDNLDTYFCNHAPDADGNDNVWLPNGGNWVLNPKSTVLLPPNNNNAYWALGYLSYFANNKNLWADPEGKVVDQWHDAGLYYPPDFWMYSCYGMCDFLVIPYTGEGTTYGKSARGPLRRHQYASPGSTIVCQDSTEQKNEGTDDTLGLFPGETEILTEWAPDNYLQPYYPGVDLYSGWWRHDNCCVTLWVTGTVSRIKKMPLTVGIDYRCYTGELPTRWPPSS